VHKSCVSRFKDGSYNFSPDKLSKIHALLRDIAAGRVVLRTPKKRKVTAEEIAKALQLQLETLPPAILARAREILELSAEGSKIELVQRVLVLHVMRRCDGNMAAGGELLRTDRKPLSRVWATLDPSPAHDPRSVTEKTRRERVAAELLRRVPPLVQTFAAELIQLPANHGSRLMLAYNLLFALALREGNGNSAIASKLLGERPQSVAYRAQRVALNKPTRTPARAAATARTTPRASRHTPALDHAPHALRARLIELAIAFARGLIAAARRASFAELSEWKDGVDGRGRL
jgi:hypothetical protein